MGKNQAEAFHQVNSKTQSNSEQVVSPRLPQTSQRRLPIGRDGASERPGV